MTEEKQENLQQSLGEHRQEAPKKRTLSWAQKMFSAKRCAVMALFAAMSLVVSFFEFPIFPAAPFLMLDFGNCFIMLVGFLLGPIEGLIVCVIKETLRILLKNGTGGVGACCGTAWQKGARHAARKRHRARHSRDGGMRKRGKVPHVCTNFA